MAERPPPSPDDRAGKSAASGTKRPGKAARPTKEIKVRLVGEDTTLYAARNTQKIEAKNKAEELKEKHKKAPSNPPDPLQDYDSLNLFRLKRILDESIFVQKGTIRRAIINAVDSISKLLRGFGGRDAINTLTFELYNALVDIDHLRTDAEKDAALGKLASAIDTARREIDAPQTIDRPLSIAYAGEALLATSTTTAPHLDEPTERYIPRQTEAPSAFFERVWRAEGRPAVYRHQLRRLDPKLVKALENEFAKNLDALAQLLPPKKAETDQILAQAGVKARTASGRQVASIIRRSRKIL